MGREKFNMKMVEFTKANLKTNKNTDKANIHGQTVNPMTVHGKRASNMV